ncbi:MAG: amidohydrolase [Acidimicrobiia bacterium]
MIVDTHTHVVSPDRRRYPQLSVDGDTIAANWAQRSAISAEQLLDAMDSCGVDAAVIVQGKGAYGYDNSYAADARPLAPERLSNASVVDMTAPDAVEVLRYWKTSCGMVGTRLFDIPPAAPIWLGKAVTAEAMAVARELRIPVSVCVLPGGLPLVARLLEQADRWPVALEHCAFVDVLVPSAERDALVGLARYPNARVKVSTLTLTRGGDPRDRFDWIAMHFGTDRMMWGSDYPQHGESYGELLALAKRASQRASPRQQGEFLGETAASVWLP